MFTLVFQGLNRQNRVWRQGVDNTKREPGVPQQPNTCPLPKRILNRPKQFASARAALTKNLHSGPRGARKPDTDCRTKYRLQRRQSPRLWHAPNSPIISRTLAENMLTTGIEQTEFLILNT